LRLRRRVPWPLLASAALVALAWALRPVTLPPPDARLRVAAIQGNIPQIRVYSEEQLALAEEVYVSQTQRLVNWEKPDLVVWPETAIPKSLTCHDDTVALMAALFAATRTPMIVGTLDYRRSVADPEHPLAFNAAVQYDAAGQPVNRYNKIKIVPFGEVTPLESLWPEWLLRWLTMGRSLTPGDAHTVFQFRDARIGVNICYEDIFPEISRAAVQRGANVLLTITNDAWYNETAGSRQHLSHAVFRAIETGRPMLRNGNNSDTCLIWPDGRVEGLLRDPASGSPFYRGSRVYDVPIWETPPLTFHTRHGNWFAHLAVLAAAVTWLWCLYRYLDRRRRLYDKVQPVV
jgi:apolipoprotein N-acyltransferase